jgi:hypothetical protein
MAPFPAEATELSEVDRQMEAETADSHGVT